MDTDLAPVVEALTELTDDELHALIDATNGVPQVAPGLLAWIDGTCNWELNRRAGLDFPLLPPDAAIPSEEDEVSIAAVVALREQFRQSGPGDTTDGADLLDAIHNLLMGARPGTSRRSSECVALRPKLPGTQSL